MRNAHRASFRRAAEGAAVRNRQARCRSFTLFELVVVIGLVGLLAGLAGAAWRGSSRAPGRDGAVTMLLSLLTAARRQAALGGEAAALWVNANPANPDRYLRYAVVCVQNETGWDPVDAGASLPAGVYIVPRPSSGTTLPTTGPGAFKVPGSDWARPSGGDIRSTALRATLTQAINGVGIEAWIGVRFSTRGTTAESGDIVVANGQMVDAGPPVAVQLQNPDDVGGLSLSQYGGVTLTNGRGDL